MFIHSLDGFSNKLKGYGSHPIGGLMGYTFCRARLARRLTADGRCRHGIGRFNDER